MPWTYRQLTGTLYRDAELIGTGYSGAKQGKNNPALQNLRNIGPVPQGTYTIGPSHNHVSKGTFTMRLIPSGSNQMFGRSGFLIHGDSISSPGTASEGCIILKRDLRQLLALSPDRQLIVKS